MWWRTKLNGMGDRTEPWGTPSLKGQTLSVMLVYIKQVFVNELRQHN